MSVRVTIEIPPTLHDRLRQSANGTGTTMRSLILQAIEDTGTEAIKTGERLTGRRHPRLISSTAFDLSHQAEWNDKRAAAPSKAAALRG
jgi:hypothetical protein